MVSQECYITLKATIDHLQQRRNSLCCDDVKRLLTELGFEVRDGKRGGHKVFTHPALSEFTSASFNCGHGKNPEIKPNYISDIIKIIRKYEAELAEYQERKNV